MLVSGTHNVTLRINFMWGGKDRERLSENCKSIKATGATSKCCCVSVVTGGSSQRHHWVTKSKMGNRKSPCVEWHINVYPSINIEKSVKTFTVKCQSVQRICFWSMEYFAFFFLHFRIYIFYKSMYRECKYYLCKQNEWMNKQMRKKQNCIKVQQETNFQGKGKNLHRRPGTPSHFPHEALKSWR